MIEYRKKQAIGDSTRAEMLARVLHLTPIAAEILAARGYDDVEAAEAFLRADLSDLHDPYAFSAMQDAVDCIQAAGESGAKICVYGDYDADGICGTAILSRYLISLGYDVLPYIPERHLEGYGLNVEAIESIASMGVELLVTVDCGITACAEIARAEELGMETVLTDHHQCPPELPECAAIINPQMGDYPFQHLCGAGVALKLVEAMGGREAALSYFDLAALATVADIVSLTGENRAIVKEGLARIAAGRCCAGVQALAEVCGCEGAKIEAQAIGFGMAPRINATGRTGSARQSLELFLTDDIAQAKKLAQALDEENKKRQQIEAGIYQDARKRIADGDADLVRDPALILCDETWNCGVIGIVASRLARLYHRPVLLFGGEDGQLTASGRSIPALHLYDSLAAFRDRFVRFGGHAMAAGLTIESANYAAFREDYLASLLETLPAETLRPKCEYDAALKPEAITRELVDALSALAPFGSGNPTPVFCVRDVCAQNVLSMGSDHQHLRFSLGDLNCVAFGEGHLIKQLRSERIDMLATADLNHFAGKTSVQARIVSLRVAAPADPTAYVMQRAWNFYDAFFCRIGYNDWMDACPFTPVLTERDAQSLLVRRLRERSQGTLAVCFTPEGARGLLEFLKQGDHTEEIGVHWGQLDDESAYNAVLLAPDFERSRLKGFDNVIVWDDFSDEHAVRALGAIGASQLFRVGSDITPFLKRAQVPRDALAQAYRAIAAQCPANALDFESFAAKTRERYGVDESLTAFALRVFAQLGLIRIEKDGSFQVKLNANAQKRDLMESALYRAAQEALPRYEARASK